MDKVVDFLQYKQDRENDLENKYLNKISAINKVFGLPTTFEKGIEILYCVVRYLEGTINGLMLLTIIQPMDDITRQQFKHNLISWLEAIIDKIKLL